MCSQPQTILITGASSGIGRALALTYASPTRNLILIGRDRSRLETIAADCRSRGANVEVGVIDVRDCQSTYEFIAKMDRQYEVDLLIANAGISTGLPSGAFIEPNETTHAIFETNVFGAINSIEPLLNAMAERRRGHIALMGSMAALRGLPFAPAYCATKGAIHLYADSLRTLLKPHGVRVSLIVPGFVHTPFNENLVSPKPLAIDVGKAAAIIERGLRRGKAKIVFPKALHCGVRLLTLLPSSLVDAAMLRLNVNAPQTQENVWRGK